MVQYPNQSYHNPYILPQPAQYYPTYPRQMIENDPFRMKVILKGKN